MGMFLTQNCSKEQAREMLIEMLKMLPNRPEIRQKFFSGYLPKSIAKYKKAIKKNKKNFSVKCESIDKN